MSARVTRKVPLHESIFKLNEKLNVLMSEMKKLRYAVLQGQGQAQGPLQQAQVQGQEAPLEEVQVEEYPVLARGPGRRSDWHYWGANWAAKNPDIPRDENFSLKMAEAYRAWKDAHPGQTYLDFRGTDVIDGRKRLTQKKGKKVTPAPRQATPPPLAPLRQPTPPPAPSRQATPPPPAPFREPTPPSAPLRQATPPPPAPLPLRQKTPNRYSQPSPGPLSTPSLLQGRRETPPQEYYEPTEEEEVAPEEEEQELLEEEVPEEQAVRVPIQESPEEEAQQQLSPEEEAAIEVAQEEQMSPEEEEQPEEEDQPEASPEWPEEEEQAQADDGDLEIVTVGQQEYFRTSNNGLFTVTRDEEGNPEIGTWAGRLSDDGTEVIESSPPNDM